MNMDANSPVRIGVLSDTHLPDSVDAYDFPDSVDAYDFLHTLIEEVLAPVDLILHAGDLVSPNLLDAFYDYPFHAVRGNMDPATQGVPHKKVIHGVYDRFDPWLGACGRPGGSCSG
jgi:predicted phosphodiesterase